MSRSRKVYVWVLTTVIVLVTLLCALMMRVSPVAPRPAYWGPSGEPPRYVQPSIVNEAQRDELAPVAGREEVVPPESTGVLRIAVLEAAQPVSGQIVTLTALGSPLPAVRRATDAEGVCSVRLESGMYGITLGTRDAVLGEPRSVEVLAGQSVSITIDSSGDAALWHCFFASTVSGSPVCGASVCAAYGSSVSEIGITDGCGMLRVRGVNPGDIIQGWHSILGVSQSEEVLAQGTVDVVTVLVFANAAQTGAIKVQLVTTDGKPPTGAIIGKILLTRSASADTIEKTAGRIRRDVHVERQVTGNTIHVSGLPVGEYCVCAQVSGHVGVPQEVSIVAGTLAEALAVIEPAVRLSGRIVVKRGLNAVSPSLLPPMKVIVRERCLPFRAMEAMCCNQGRFALDVPRNSSLAYRVQGRAILPATGVLDASLAVVDPLVIEVMSAVRVNGRMVSKHSGLPLIGWRVKAVDNESGLPVIGGVSTMVESDADGAFALWLDPASTYQISVMRAGGGKSERAPGFEKLCPSEEGILLSLDDECGSLEGVIEGVANGTLRVAARDERGRVVAGMVSANGVFALTDVPTGRYSIWLEAATPKGFGCVPYLLDSDVAIAGNRLVVHYACPSAKTVNVRAMTQAGVDVEKFVLRWFGSDGRLCQWPSGESGSVRLTGWGSQVTLEIVAHAMAARRWQQRDWDNELVAVVLDGDRVSECVITGVEDAQMPVEMWEYLIEANGRQFARGEILGRPDGAVVGTGGLPFGNFKLRLCAWRSGKIVGEWSGQFSLGDGGRRVTCILARVAK